jgi:hypothetical protein
MGIGTGISPIFENLSKFTLGDITWLLRDDFLTNIAAGSVDGTPAEPGPGTRAVTDTGNDLSISGGELVVIGNNAWGDPEIHYDTPVITREPGLLLLFHSLFDDGLAIEIGFDNDLISRPQSNFFRAGTNPVEVNGRDIDSLTDQNYYWWAIALRSTGAYHFIKGDPEFPDWALVYASPILSHSPLYIALDLYHVITDKVSTFRIPDPSQGGCKFLPSPILSDGFGATPPDAIDSGDGGHDGTYNDVALRGEEMAFLGDPVDGGAGPYVQLPSASLDTPFDYGEHALIIRAQADFWSASKGTTHRLFDIGKDVSNYTYFRTYGQQFYWYSRGGGVQQGVNESHLAYSGVLTFGVTRSESADEMKAYKDGSQVGTTQSGLGTFVGPLADGWCTVGAVVTGAAEAWGGWASDAIVTLNGVVPDATDMSDIHDYLDAGTLTKAILDDILGVGNYAWWKLDEEAPLSDGLGHPEGIARGIGLGGGSEQYELYGNYFLDGSGELGCHPAKGANDLLNPFFSDWTADDPDDWAVTEDLVNTEVCEVATGEAHADCGTPGGEHCNMWRSGGASRVFMTQNTLTAGRFYLFTIDVDTHVSGSMELRDGSGGYQFDNICSGAGVERYVGLPVGNLMQFRSDADPTDITFDDFLAQPLSWSDIFQSIERETPDVLIEVELTIDSNMPAGLVLNLDDPDNPQNFTIVYFERSQARIRVGKMVAGTFSVVSTTADVYGAGDVLRVIKDGTSVRVYYDNTFVVADTISDAGIIDNVYHGLLSPWYANRADNLVIYARGTSGEYDPYLDPFIQD